MAEILRAELPCGQRVRLERSEEPRPGMVYVITEDEPLGPGEEGEYVNASVSVSSLGHVAALLARAADEWGDGNLAYGICYRCNREPADRRRDRDGAWLCPGCGT